MIKINNLVVDTFKFPAGEIGFKLCNTHGVLNCLAGAQEILVEAHLKSSDDIMSLLLVCNAIKERNPLAVLSLALPYIPYGRQDRVCDYGESFSLRVMAQLINSIGAQAIITYDPHSDVTGALINNLVVESQECAPILHGITQGKLLVCPDAGAEKKILKYSQSYIMCRKVRNPITGDIRETKVDTAGYPITGRDLMIVDDICDGGRTFIEIAKILREHKPNSIELYVTHGIFSKGLQVFEGLIDKVHYLDYDNGTITTKEIG